MGGLVLHGLKACVSELGQQPPQQQRVQRRQRPGVLQHGLEDGSDRAALSWQRASTQPGWGPLRRGRLCQLCSPPAMQAVHLSRTQTEPFTAVAMLAVANLAVDGCLPPTSPKRGGWESASGGVAAEGAAESAPPSLQRSHAAAASLVAQLVLASTVPWLADADHHVLLLACVQTTGALRDARASKGLPCAHLTGKGRLPQPCMDVPAGRLKSRAQPPHTCSLYCLTPTRSTASPTALLVQTQPMLAALQWQWTWQAGRACHLRQLQAELEQERLAHQDDSRAYEIVQIFHLKSRCSRPTGPARVVPAAPAGAGEESSGRGSGEPESAVGGSTRAHGAGSQPQLKPPQRVCSTPGMLLGKDAAVAGTPPHEQSSIIHAPAPPVVCQPTRSGTGRDR
jgi:hypothetical protein